MSKSKDKLRAASSRIDSLTEPLREEPVTQEYKVPVDSFIAKKDFVIHHNGYLKVIKAGDDLSDVPEQYHANLKTEGVL